MAEYLSDEQVSRYGRFPAAPSSADLERFFYLDAPALAKVVEKRGPHNRLGWSVQWGTVRMLGTFLLDPRDVPHVAVDYVAEQIGVADPSCIKLYPERAQIKWDHQSEIRELLEYREFAEVKVELLRFLGSRVRNFRVSRRELFDRAVVWLIDNKVVLPGITVLERLVRDVRKDELDAINVLLAERTPVELRRELLETLEVPDGRRLSTLEWMRTTVTDVSGTGQGKALERVEVVWALGGGAVDTTGGGAGEAGRARRVRDVRQGPEDQAVGGDAALGQVAGDGPASGGRVGGRRAAAVRRADGDQAAVARRPGGAGAKAAVAAEAPQGRR